MARLKPLSAPLVQAPLAVAELQGRGVVLVRWKSQVGILCKVSAGFAGIGVPPKSHRSTTGGTSLKLMRLLLSSWHKVIIQSYPDSAGCRVPHTFALFANVWEIMEYPGSSRARVSETEPTRTPTQPKKG